MWLCRFLNSLKSFLLRNDIHWPIKFVGLRVLFVPICLRHGVNGVMKELCIQIKWFWSWSWCWSPLVFIGLLQVFKLLPLSSSPPLPLFPKLHLRHRHCQRRGKLLHQWQLQWQKLRRLGWQLVASHCLVALGCKQKETRMLLIKEMLREWG